MLLCLGILGRIVYTSKRRADIAFTQYSLKFLTVSYWAIYSSFRSLLLFLIVLLKIWLPTFGIVYWYIWWMRIRALKGLIRFIWWSLCLVLAQSPERDLVLIFAIISFCVLKTHSLHWRTKANSWLFCDWDFASFGICAQLLFLRSLSDLGPQIINISSLDMLRTWRTCSFFVDTTWRSVITFRSIFLKFFSPGIASINKLRFVILVFLYFSRVLIRL